MINFLKKIPWWLYFAVAIAIFVWIQIASGASISRKLWDQVKNQIVADKAQIIDDLEKQNTIDEAEKGRLYQEIAKIQQQRAVAQADRDKLVVENKRLRDAFAKINIPSDPNALVDLLRKLGLKSAIIDKP